MNRRSMFVLAAVLSVAGATTAACTSAGAPSTASATAPVLASGAGTAAAASASASATSQGASTKALTETQLGDAMLTAAELPKPGYQVGDTVRTGTNSYFGRHSTFEGTGVLFGFVDDADKQPCAALLNALGYGDNVKPATVWASMSFGKPGTSLGERLAAYPPGEAATVFAGLATAGTAGCRQVTDERNGKLTETLTALGIGPVGATGGTTAGASTLVMLPPTSGSRIYLFAAAQVGDYIVIVDGSTLDRTGTATFDQALLTDTLKNAVAKLAAAAGR